MTTDGKDEKRATSGPSVAGATAAAAASSAASSSAAAPAKPEVLTPAQFEAMREKAAAALLPDMRLVLSDRLTSVKAQSPFVRKQIDPHLLDLATRVQPEVLQRTAVKFD